MTQTLAFAFRAELGAYSSVLGASVHLVCGTGKMIGQIAFTCHDDALRDRALQERLAGIIVSAVNEAAPPITGADHLGDANNMPLHADTESLRVEVERLRKDMEEASAYIDALRKENDRQDKVIDRLQAERDAALAQVMELDTKRDRPTFPILKGDGARIDFQLVADHGGQAQSNHYQSVKRLAERGGLSWTELYAVLHDRKFEKMNANEAMIACRALEARYLAALTPPPDAGLDTLDDQALCEWIEAKHPGSVAFADEPIDFHHQIEVTPPVLREIITALRSRPAGVPWQDVETAPRDRSQIIVAVPDQRRAAWIVGEAYFDPEVSDWFWAGTGPNDYFGGPISEMNHWLPEIWQPMPAPDNAPARIRAAPSDAPAQEEP